ncbi:hypothetical protein [Methylomagnum ishizawai]|uniref:hypothetical protein n=1 Tax=Methylomagnum ishizawai TaxID=1760988 RepID=UPI001C327D1B|nr:hypothetical protein [Methylomagnum ishizawai]BBL77062.1 hypothetical protein MishRS11D_41600 [Methylomagnum ishizawai]
MKLRVLPAALLLTLTGPGDAATLGNNELFLEVWNGQSDNTGRSYIRDLGISLDAFMDAPDCYQRVLADLGADTNLASLKLDGSFPAGTVWTIQALNDDSPGAETSSIVAAADNDPQSPKNHSGFLTTLTRPGQLDDLASVYQQFSVVAAQMGIHLTAAAVEGSKSFKPGDTGFYNGADGSGNDWGEFMGNGVGFNRNQTLGTASPMYFFTVDITDYNTGVLGNNGQSYGQWSFDGTQVSFTNPNHPDIPDTCPKPAACDLPWGGQIADGKSVLAYRSSLSDDCAGNSETRICSNGSLSGSFTHESCAVPKACDLPWGGTLASGKSVDAYSAGESADCATAKQTRTCDNGVLSGGYTFKSCVPLSCDLPWGGKLASGQGVTAYQTAVSADCEAVKQTRACANGVLGGEYTQQACAAPKACDLPWGGQIASGQSVAAYSASVSADCEAAKEIRSCDNGVLGGGNTLESCAAPKACDLPWGGQIASGGSVTAYQNDKSPYCDQETETRSCDNGVLSGLYTQPACSVAAYGPYVQLLSPNGGETWSARTAQTVAWTSVNIAAKQRLNLYFSKNGGKHWSLLKKGLPALGQIRFKPGPKRVGGAAMLAICQPITRHSLGKCDKSNAVFAITK